MEKSSTISNVIEQNNALHGLRGVAVLLVFLDHSSTRDHYISRYWNFIGIGKAGVFLFFVLSAYLLTRRLWRGENLDQYFFKRLLRIAPLYYLCLLFVGVLQLVNKGPNYNIVYFDNGWQGLIQHFLFIQGDFLLWTIPVEIKFYLILPVYVFFLKKFPKVTAIFLSITGIVVFSCSYLEQVWHVPNYLIQIIPILDRKGYYDVFICGTLLSYMLSKYPLPQLNRITRRNGGLYLMSVLAAIFVLSARDLPGRPFVHDYGISASLLWAMIWVSVILLVECGNQGIVKVLSVKWLVRIGKSGFGWYLGHLFVFAAINYAVPLQFQYVSSLKLALSFVVSYYLFWGSYIYIEKPFIKIANPNNRLRHV